MERNDKCFCGSGIKYKKCHYRIHAESKLANVYKVYNDYKNACAQKGICNACTKGCSQCCNDYFFVTENEFLLILEELLYRKADIKDYISRAKNVIDYVGKIHPEILKKLNECMPLSFDKMDISFFRDTINPKDLPKCIFLDDNNRCSIYNVRPTICRGYGMTEVCEIINNEKKEFQENDKMYMETSVISRTDGMGSEIIKRPYPLFYWFAFFLDDPKYNLTMEKVKRIGNTKNDDYYDFTIKLQRI